MADIGAILAALAAGAASAYSPYAARGIGTAANVLGAFDENRYRKIQAQRVQEGLAKEAEQRRRQEHIRTQTDRLIDENTEFGPPFKPPPGGIGAGLPLQQARLAKLLNAQDTTQALQLLEKRIGQPSAQPLAQIQGIRLGQGEKLKAKTQEGFEYERDVPKPEPRKIRFDVFDDPRGNRMQVQTDETTGQTIKSTSMGRVRVPNDISIQAFTDESGNRIVAGVSPGGGVAFQKAIGKTGEKGAKFSTGQFRKDLALRSRNRPVADPEVQALDPATAGQVLKDLSSGADSLFEFLMMGGAGGGSKEESAPAPAARPTPKKMTPQEEANRYLQGQ